MRGVEEGPKQPAGTTVEGAEIGKFSPFRLGDVNVFCVVLDFSVCVSFV